MSTITNITDKFSIYVNNSLEQYRADSFFTKEPETVAWINTFKTNNVFYDIGANIGVYTLYAAAIRNVRTYSFEPYYKNYLSLIENVKLNNIQNLCAPILCGLAEVTKFDSFFVLEERIGSSGHQIGEAKDEFGKPFKPVTKYPLLTYSLDDFIESFKSPIPNYIKIDVDGLEPNIIDGMNNTLKNEKLESICIEFNMTKDKKEEYIDRFYELGFVTENTFNNLENHSRFRRKVNNNRLCENVIFTRF